MADLKSTPFVFRHFHAGELLVDFSPSFSMFLVFYHYCERFLLPLCDTILSRKSAIERKIFYSKKYLDN